jgi:hypothetical protein
MSLSSEEASAIWAEIRANRRKLDECPRHLFVTALTNEELRVALGQRVTCLNCGGSLQLTQAGEYVRGYAAAGRDPNDVWPGWT